MIWGHASIQGNYFVTAVPFFCDFATKLGFSAEKVPNRFGVGTKNQYHCRMTLIDLVRRAVGMGCKLGPMDIKIWTPKEVAALVDLARNKGITKTELARDYLAVTPQALQNWITGKTTPPRSTRRLLYFAELAVVTGQTVRELTEET